MIPRNAQIALSISRLTGDVTLYRAVRLAEADDLPGGDPLDQARVIFEQANRLVTRGDMDQAEHLLRQAHQMFTAGASELEAAVVMGSIADIAYQRGDYDEALRIRQEIELPAYERLGVAREAAMTWGQITDIHDQRGNYDEAAELRRRMLDVRRQLGDLGGIAIAQWGLAQLDLRREDYESAFHRMIESFQISRRLQRPDGIAIVGSTLGQFLIAAGDIDGARQVLGDSLAAARKLGWADRAQQMEQLLSTLPPDGATDRAAAELCISSDDPVLETASGTAPVTRRVPGRGSAAIRWRGGSRRGLARRPG